VGVQGDVSPSGTSPRHCDRHKNRSLKTELSQAEHPWLMPVILATQEAEKSGGSRFKVSPDKQCVRPYLEKTHHKKGLVEWLKVEALSSNSSTARKKKFW
jgi:hypothetical protein